jgi:flagellar M-ring protein FliF
MSAPLKTLGKQWQQLGFNQKVMLGTLVLGLIIGTGFLFTKAQDDYDVLYANLNVADASATVAKLKEAKAPYRLADGGTTILVPRSMKNDLVLDTAGELSGEQPVSLSQIPPIVQGDVQKEWIKKFNTDAIANILRSIRGIKNAQVIVSQPEQDLFSESAKEPTASVMLMVEPGFRLKADQVKNIKNLVAHAVPGMKPESVAIADNSGNALDDVNAGVGSATSEADMRRRTLEEETTRKILAILSPVVGRENTVVSVSAQLNFDQQEAEIRRVIPVGGTAEAPTGLPVSEQEQLEQYAGGKDGGDSAGASAGTSSNIPTYQATEAADDGKKDKEYRLRRRTTNFANSEEARRINYAQGTLERLTVAVVMNKVLTAKETEEIRELVANAAGIDFARGDSVDIKGFQFSQPPANKEKELMDSAKEAGDQAFIIQIVSVVGVVLLGFAALTLFFLLLRRPADGEIVDDGTADYPGAMLPPNLDAAMAFMPKNNEPEEDPLKFLQEQLDPDLESKRKSINAYVDQDPSEAARFLLSYMKDE